MTIPSSTLSAASTQNAASDETATENAGGPGRVGDLAFRAGDPRVQSDAHRSAMLRLNDPEHELHHLRDKVKTFQKRDSSQVHFTLKDQLPLPTDVSYKKTDQQHIGDLEYRLHDSLAKLLGKLEKELEWSNSRTHLPAKKTVVVSPPSDPRSTAGVTDLSSHCKGYVDPGDRDRLIVQHETPLPGVGISVKKNVRRKEMEDRSSAGWISVSLGGRQIDMFLSFVLDGHGGSHYAQYAKDVLPAKVKEHLEICNPPTGLTPLGIANGLTQALIATDRGGEISATGKFVHDAEGCTANLCLMYERHIWVANVGDSRAIFVSPETELQLSDDATAWLTKGNGERVAHPRFNAGVERRGGIVIGNGVDGSNALARAVGDHFLEGAESARPKFTHIKVPDGMDLDGCYIVQVSDGAHDELSTEIIARRVRRGHAEGYVPAVNSSQINQEACLAGSDDDVTVMLIKLDELGTPPAPTATEA